MEHDNALITQNLAAETVTLQAKIKRFQEENVQLREVLQKIVALEPHKVAAAEQFAVKQNNE